MEENISFNDIKNIKIVYVTKFGRICISNRKDIDRISILKLFNSHNFAVRCLMINNSDEENRHSKRCDFRIIDIDKPLQNIYSYILTKIKNYKKDIKEIHYTIIFTIYLNENEISYDVDYGFKSSLEMTADYKNISAGISGIIKRSNENINTDDVQYIFETNKNVDF